MEKGGSWDKMIKHRHQHWQHEQELFKSFEILHICHRIALKSSFEEIASSYLIENPEQINLRISKIVQHLQSEQNQQALTESLKIMSLSANLNETIKEAVSYLHIQSQIKCSKSEQALQTLLKISTALLIQENPTETEKYLKLKSRILHASKKQAQLFECHKQLQSHLLHTYGESSHEYAEHVIEKGHFLATFERGQEALSALNQGLKLLIQLNDQNKVDIAQVYISIASCHRKNHNFEKEYSSLICAEATLLKLPGVSEHMIKVLHLIGENLVKQEKYSKAYKDLSRLREVELKLYGKASPQVDKTQTWIEKVKELSENSKAAGKQEFPPFLGFSILNTDKKGLLPIDTNSWQN